ncbi:ABC transporter substrate-binding protein [Streptomyces sp. NBRC 110028]|uniref:ABC transporter substrate-binding protein n=1 Tax=Streptomyces sp. NBRC 110028 TaxID=1621260 RepID=UPI00131EA3F9|nr:ABC transporter substrate-binding protein [Streptomyces sp. NBRC 110028]
MTADLRAGPPTRRTTFLGLAGLGLTGLATASGCRLAVDEARGATGDSGAHRGGTLTIAMNLDARPVAAQAHQAQSVVWRRMVFETLTEYDAAGIPRPLLATSWKITDGGRTVALRLRDDVRFHSGRPMTSKDVIFSLKRTADPVAVTQARAVSAHITDMTADGDHALRIRLGRPAGNLFDMFELASILDRESAAGLASGKEVVGTGPFAWRSWAPGSHLTLVRNRYFRTRGRPYLDRIDMPCITDPTALVTAVRSGRADIAYGAAPLDAKGLSRDDRYVIDLGTAVDYAVSMDVRAHPFDKPEVRRAVGYALDRERVLSQVFAGYGRASSLWWTDKEPGWSREQSDAYTYDRTRARRMIEQSGAKGAEVMIDVIAVQAALAAAQIVRYDLSAAGLSVRTRVLDPIDFSARQAAGKLGHMFINGYGIADLSAATLVGAHPAFAATNSSHFHTPEYTAAINRAATASSGERKAAVRALGAYMQRHAFSQSIATTRSAIIRSKRARGLGLTYLGCPRLDNTYLV